MEHLASRGLGRLTRVLTYLGEPEASAKRSEAPTIDSWQVAAGRCCSYVRSSERRAAMWDKLSREPKITRIFESVDSSGRTQAKSEKSGPTS